MIIYALPASGQSHRGARESRVADSGSFVCWLGPNADEVKAVAGRTWLARARDIGEQGPLTH